MTVQEFIDFFNGIYCDYDGAYGDQCFDLANGYSRWIGGPRFTGATADLIINQAGTFYTRINNAADNFPIKGDIVVWDWPHVAIATGDNTDSNKFDALEQNDPANSDCHLKSYNYNGVLGWLRPKQLPQSVDQSIIDDLRKTRDDNWNLYEVEVSINNDLKVKNQEYLSKISSQAEDLKNDANLASDLLAAHRTIDNFISKLGLPAGTSNEVALERITALQVPHQEVFKQVQPLVEGFAEQSFMKRAPKKGKNLFAKLIDAIKNLPI